MFQPSFWSAGPISRKVSLALGLILVLLLGAYSALSAGVLTQEDAGTAGVTTTVTHVLPYQGRLLEPSTGAPKDDGNYPMTFRLYTVESGGSAIWTETKTLAVAGGLFHTFLGDATPLNLGDFNGQNLWIGVTVGSEAEASPRLRLGFGAYAFFAENAANAAIAENAAKLGGQAPADFAATSHNHSAGQITSGTLADARIPASITRDNEVMSIVLDNDGSGSGLDADLLDGLDSSAFAPVSHSHDDRYYTKSEGDGRYLRSGAVNSLSVTNNAGAIFSLTQGGTHSGLLATTNAPFTEPPDFSSAGKAALVGRTANAGPNMNNVAGIFGTSSESFGVAGTSGTNSGVIGFSSSGTGVNGQSTSGVGVRAFSSTGTALVVLGSSQFNGPATFSSTVTKPTGSFKIDHPLDPENMYLYHSFVESPDMMNVYNGNVVLDDAGEAWVDMPDYFETLNRDFRYQLTAIGAPGPSLYIGQEVAEGRFLIAGGAPGLQVSWQVTGIRQDPYAQMNPIQVEVDKPEHEQGTYLYPEAYGFGPGRSLDARLFPELGEVDSPMVKVD